MTFVITDPCIDTMDQSCVDVCPVDCIHFEEGVDRVLYIDPVECIDCGACVPACPVNAIFVDSEVPADQARFTEINVLWYSDRAAARAQVGEGSGAAPAAAPAASDETASAAGDEAAPAETAAPAAAAPSPEPAEAELTASLAQRLADADTYKHGEAGVEGKCALCGQYVIKGGTRFRRKSVLCSDCAPKQASIGNPYRVKAGGR